MAASATPARPGDAFPAGALAALVRRMPAYARLAWRLGRDPRLPRSRRLAVLAAAAYLVSPVDLVPGIIPVAGQLDDAAVGLAGLRLALRGLSPADRSRVLAAAGIGGGDLDTDLATVRATTGWLLRRGGRLGLRGLKMAGRLGGRTTRALLRAAR